MNNSFFDMDRKRKYNQYNYNNYNNSNNSNRPYNNRYNKQRSGEPAFKKPCSEPPPEPVKSEKEVKIENLITAVRSQKGIRGQIVIIQRELENASAVLQNAVTSANAQMKCDFDDNLKKYALSINQEVLATGDFLSKQLAKSALCQESLDKLKLDCFTVIKSKNYEEISNSDLAKQPAIVTPNAFECSSKAHQMMVKMGWGGKGLGAQEQGLESSDTVIENATRQSLSGNNVMKEINRVLEEFANSSKTTILAFDPEITKEERALIHKIAQKFNLKTKSEGKESRRITVYKKIDRFELVKELLKDGEENQCYTLTIPPNFQNLWTPQSQPDV